jgi:membrane protease YdiL (CAAX protease family)
VIYNKEKSIEFLVMLDVSFVVLLAISSSISGFLSTLVYNFAFIIPVLVGFYMTRDDNKNEDFLKPSGVRPSLPFIAPTILVVMIISFITSSIISALTNKSNVADLGDHVMLAIITHAVVPAIFEEALFRLIPLRAMKGESWPKIIVYSALFFSLIHHSFFSMPYAFIAGAVFMLLDLACDSVLPSVIIHFLNNAISVLFIFYGESLPFFVSTISVIVALSIVSMIYIVRNIGKYEIIKEKLKDIGDIKSTPPREILILAVPMLILAVTELIQ